MPGWGLVPTYGEVWRCHGGISTLFCRKIPHYFHTISTLSTPPFFVPKPFSCYVSTTYEIMPKVGTQIVI